MTSPMTLPLKVTSTLATSPLIIGHRGASAIESENSVGAFARARADGADGV